MRLGPILIVFLIVAAAYILPQVVATFTGTHTMEVNATGASSLTCTGCHGVILAELNATPRSREVFQAHRNAAGNTTYTSNWLTSEITNTTDSDVCLLCHLAEFEVGGSHTQVIIRACTDVDCHGNNETSNNSLYPTATGNASAMLSGENVHSRWFDEMSGYNSSARNETGANYTTSYWACMGCHTEVGMDINVTEAVYLHNDSSAARRRYL